MLKKARTVIRHPLCLCCISFTFCFGLALLLFLPLEPWTRQLEELVQRQGLILHIEAPQKSFPLTISAQNVQLRHPQFPHRPILLGSLDIRPLWLTLLSDNPAIHFNLEAYQGSVTGRAYRNGQLEATLSGLKFNESLAPQYPLAVIGQVDKAEFNGIIPFVGDNRSQLKLNISQLVVSGLHNFGSNSDQLRIGQLSCKAQTIGPLVKIDSLEGSGPALLLNGKGSLRLGRTAARSRLNGQLNIVPQEALDPLLRDLLSMIKNPDKNGDIKLNITGPLTRVRLK